MKEMEDHGLLSDQWEDEAQNPQVVPPEADCPGKGFGRSDIAHVW